MNRGLVKDYALKLFSLNSVSLVVLAIAGTTLGCARARFAGLSTFEDINDAILLLKSGS